MNYDDAEKAQFAAEQELDEAVKAYDPADKKALHRVLQAQAELQQARHKRRQSEGSSPRPKPSA